MADIGRASNLARIPQYGAGPRVDIYDLVAVGINHGNIRYVYRMAGLEATYFKLHRALVFFSDYCCCTIDTQTISKHTIEFTKSIRNTLTKLAISAIWSFVLERNIKDA